jgi:hypothetical protein
MRDGRADSVLQITEFEAAGGQRLRDEDGDTPDWVEIQNRSNQPVDLAGWILSEQSRHVRSWPLPATNLPPGEFVVLFASGKDRRDPGKPWHTNFKLPAQNGSLILHGPEGQISRIEHYPLQVPGVSFGLVERGPASDSKAPGAGEHPKTGDPDDGFIYTYLTAPTPGKTNAPAACLGPRIEWLDQQPAGQPAFDEPLSVRARIAAFQGTIKEVRLRFRVMFGNETELEMFDDGNHGDGAAGDGVYGAVIPAKTAKPDQLVRYFVTARDEFGQASRWPLFGVRPDYSSYEGTVVADPAVQTRLPVVNLFTPTNQRLGQRTGSGGAVLYYQVELYDNVELTLHGQISRSFPKQSYNVHFPHDHHFRYQTNQARVRGVTLMANFADKSKIRNTLAYEMIAASGSVGHFAFPVRVQMNGKFFSVAEVVEKGNGRWLERVGRDPQGALYKMNNNLSGAAGAEKKTRKYESPRDLASFARALSEQQHPLEERAAYAYSHIDLPQCISYLVAMALISSDDHGHKNYYLYRDSRHSGEWALFPWDVDLSWGRNWTGQYFDETMFVDNPLDLYRNGRQKARNRLYNLLLRYPEFRQMYLRRLRTVMDELLQPPGTPPESLIIEKRVRELLNLVDPPDVKPSDAARDESAWPSWGERRSARRECQRIMSEYLPGRRQYLFTSGRAVLYGDPIPGPQPPDATLEFVGSDLDLPAPEQSVCLTNRNPFALDVSGWRLAGAGISHRFRPGTVVPQSKAIYVAADVAVFRKKLGESSPPTFVQGDWTGELRTSKGNLTLTDRNDRLVARFDLPSGGSGPP